MLRMMYMPTILCRDNSLCVVILALCSLHICVEIVFYVCIVESGKNNCILDLGTPLVRL